MRFTFIVLALLLSWVWGTNATFANSVRTLCIDNQQQFDCLQSDLMKLVDEGALNIKIVLSPRLYEVKEEHICLFKINNPNLTISILGNGAILTGKGAVYKGGDKFIGHFSPYYSWTNEDTDVNVWSDVKYAEGLVEVVDEKAKRCRIKINEQLLDNISDAYIHIPHWYNSSIYPIERIVNNYIYFVASDLTKNHLGVYNINDDFNYGNQDIRFKLCNVYSDRPHVQNGILKLQKDEDRVRVSRVQRYLTVRGCTLGSLLIRDLCFLGNSSENAGPLIYLGSNKCNQIIISKCIFKGVKSDVITISATPNVHIENSDFHDCYKSCITSGNQCSNTLVNNNTFVRTGKQMLNLPCISCNGSNFSISNNTITDFGYCGIGVGVWYKAAYNNPCFGEINNNKLVFTNEYVKDIANYGLMDGGAIYVWTKTDGIVISNNVIQNYTGLHYNNGIYCDDGAYNITIAGNLITGIRNGCCIDSRRVSSVEKRFTPSSGIEHSNINVAVRDNIVDGIIKMEGKKIENNGCVKGTNYILHVGKKDKSKNIYKNFSVESDDVMVLCDVINNKTMHISKVDQKRLSKLKIWKSIKSNFIW